VPENLSAPGILTWNSEVKQIFFHQRWR